MAKARVFFNRLAILKSLHFLGRNSAFCQKFCMFAIVALTPIFAICQTVTEVKRVPGKGVVVTIVGRPPSKLEEPPSVVTHDNFDLENWGYKIPNLRVPNEQKSLLTDHWLENLRKQMLDKINSERALHGLSRLTLDATATRAAQMQAAEQSRHRENIGHFNIHGHMPYTRYTLAGGRDYVAENAAQSRFGYRDPITKRAAANIWNQHHPSCVSLHSGIKAPFYPSAIDLSFLVSTSVWLVHCKMYNQSPGEDGHRKNILDPYHTAVGIGIDVGVVGDELVVAYYEEFVNKYVEWTADLPQIAQPNSWILVSGEIIDSNRYEFVKLDVFFETGEPKTLPEMEASHSYSFPKKAFEVYTSRDLKQTKDGLIEGSIKLGGQPGVYTLVMSLRDKSKGQVFWALSRSIFVRP